MTVSQLLFNFVITQRRCRTSKFNFSIFKMRRLQHTSEEKLGFATKHGNSSYTSGKSMYKYEARMANIILNITKFCHGKLDKSGNWGNYKHT
jgi:hypothetical protein